MKTKHTVIMLVVLAGLPLLAIAAWQKTSIRSNGITPVEIVAAPGASTTRTITANGGIRVFNGWTNSVSFFLRELQGTTSNTLGRVTLAVNQLYISDWVHVLNATTNSVELTCVEACGDGLFIFTHYRDEAQ